MKVQAESVPVPGADDAESCSPVYTLQYLPSGEPRSTVKHFETS